MPEHEQEPQTCSPRWGRRWFVVWHQDSPGVRVTVRRWWRPRTPFSRVGEPFVYGATSTFPRAEDVT